MSKPVKYLLCMLELFIAFLLIMSLPLTMLATFYSILYNPMCGMINLFLAGFLGADLVMRACEGEGVAW